MAQVRDGSAGQFNARSECSVREIEPHQEGPTGDCEEAAIMGSKRCGILNQAFAKFGKPAANML